MKRAGWKKKVKRTVLLAVVSRLRQAPNVVEMRMRGNQAP